jgi:CubicO group peptidase (beta-lactamase class C family)
MIRRGLEGGVYPGAAISIGDKNGEIYSNFYGYRALQPASLPMECDTMFDMASLTKIFSTTMVALKLIEKNKLRLEDTLSLFFCAPKDKKDINITQLMTHTSGLPADIDLEKEADSPAGACTAILNTPLLAKPGALVEYSCLGFILLGKICETIAGAGLDILAREYVFEPLGLTSTGYCPDIENNGNFAITEYANDKNSWLCGIVHDENARFLNGISGNAGVFSNIKDAALFAKMLANRGSVNGQSFIDPELFNEAIKIHTPQFDEGRGLGFAIKSRVPVSCGTIFPVGSYGHTGFTGTSLWVDAETTQYVVFLTNRVHPTRENVKLLPFRGELCDCCAREYRRN